MNDVTHNLEALHLAAGTSERMFGPLNFEENSYSLLVNNTETKCLLCEDSFNFSISLSLFLRHLFDVHSFVIEEVQNIEHLSEYILYWRNKFKTIPFEQVIPSIDIGSNGQKYFLLSTLLKEDKELRHKIKLDYVLRVQEFERTDKNFTRPCLMCSLNYEGLRAGYLEHLSTKHNLQLGNPQNLVFIDYIIDHINKKLKDLKCLFCERTFTDRNVLKEHMRKKLHKRINPHNVEYDKYYIVNYLELNKNWQAIQHEPDRYAMSRGAEENSDEEYSDWNEPGDQINCLFCKYTDVDINNICLHMDAEHDYDFVLTTSNMDFYQKIKLVNYIRRQIHTMRCILCDKLFKTTSEMNKHMVEEKHYKNPEVKIFDQPEFYFPTYENDAFLYFIDDIED